MLGRLTHLLFASACVNTACYAAQCNLILGYDLYGNDLLGPDGKPAPQNVSGPAACCNLCSTKAHGTTPKGVCKAWSYNHGTSTCWMKTGHGNSIGCAPNELCPNGDTSGVVLSAEPADPAEDLQRRIDAAIRSGVKDLSVAAGDYFFGNRTLRIQGAQNFTLRAASANVTFWFTNSDGGVLIKDCYNLSVRGFGPGKPLRVDRSPPPWSQGTVTKTGPKVFEFTLDGDSADPRSILPERMNQGMIGPECASWTKGSQASDHAERPWSRGLPNGHACPSGALKQLGARHFSAQVGKGGPPAVGDQFVKYAWKGMSYVVANSTVVLTQDVAIHAAGDMAIAEMDGTGGHIFRRVELSPRSGRIISSNADAFHSSDMDTAATLEGCHFRAMLDDFLNFQSTLLFAIPSGNSTGTAQSASSTTWTLVHPHVSDQPDDIGDDGKPVVDHWYGTTEPLSRVQANEELIFHDPVNFTELGRVHTARAPKLVSPAADQNSTWAKQADGLVKFLADGPGCLKKSPSVPQPCVPYNYGGFGGEPGAAVTGQGFQSSVYSVELQQPPPTQSRPGAMAAIPYVVQISKTRAKGAIVRNCVFEDSTGFFARWKSSDAVMENNTFRGNGFPIIEMQVLPSFYEGPPHTTNVTVRNNSFGVGDAGSNFQRVYRIPGNPKGAWQKGISMKNVIDVGPPCCEVSGLSQTDNEVFCAC